MTASAPETAAPRPAVLLLFAVACGLAVANVYFAQPLLDTLADEFALDRATAGLPVTVTQIGYGLGLLLLVPLGDLLPRRALIVGQSLLSALALVAVALAPGPDVLLGALGVVGLLAVVTQVLVAHVASLVPPARRGRAVGSVTGGIVIGILLARTVSGALADLAGWRSVYATSAGATLALALLLRRALPVEPAPSRLSYARLIGSTFALLAREPLLRVRATLAMLIFGAVNLLLTPLVLPLSAPPHSLSHTQVGLFGLAGVAGALGARGAGRSADRGQAQRATGLGLLAMLLAWVPIALLPWSLWALVAGVIAIDFGLQSVHVANQGLVLRLRPEARSRLTAAYMSFYSLGSAVGALASTWLYARAGWSGVCAAGAVTSAVALLFWRATRQGAPDADAPPAGCAAAAPD
ncbi:MFS transporter [Derxia lacustris]|uniref:MFS transporter n=1 Tax=Derxia lacustris TaxID=764842 RepID=UPI000A17840B|nr:MFS transporter [Derxia lacustris]